MEEGGTYYVGKEIRSSGGYGEDNARHDRDGKSYLIGFLEGFTARHDADTPRQERVGA